MPQPAPAAPPASHYAALTAASAPAPQPGSNHALISAARSPSWDYYSLSAFFSELNAPCSQGVTAPAAATPGQGSASGIGSPRSASPRLAAYDTQPRLTPVPRNEPAHAAAAHVALSLEFGFIAVAVASMAGLVAAVVCSWTRCCRCAAPPACSQGDPDCPCALPSKMGGLFWVPIAELARMLGLLFDAGGCCCLLPSKMLCILLQLCRDPQLHGRPRLPDLQLTRAKSRGHAVLHELYLGLRRCWPSQSVNLQKHAMSDSRFNAPVVSLDSMLMSRAALKPTAAHDVPSLPSVNAPQLTFECSAFQVRLWCGQHLLGVSVPGSARVPHHPTPILPYPS